MKLELFENKNVEHLDELRELEELISKKYSKAWNATKSGVVLFRGGSRNSNLVEVPERTMKRRSRYSTDAQDITLDLAGFDSRWQGYPERGYSVFTSLISAKLAKAFGNPMIVLPSDDVNAFGKAVYDFNESESWPALSELFGDRSFADFLESVIRISTISANELDVEQLCKIVSERYEYISPEQVYEAIGPEANRFKLVSDLSQFGRSDRGEVWFRGDHLLIAPELFEKLIKHTSLSV